LPVTLTPEHRTDDSKSDSPECGERLGRAKADDQNVLAVAYAPDAELPGFARTSAARERCNMEYRYKL